MLPKTLAVNAAKDATELVAKLRAFHHTAQVRRAALRCAAVRQRCAAARLRCLLPVELGVLS